MRTIGMLLALGALMVSGGLAQAESLTWRVQSYHPYIVHFKLFSQDRNHVWPSSSRVWVLDDSEVHEIPITCNYGEKICFGAWPSGNMSSYWGAGSDGDEACESCCYRCDGGQTKIEQLFD